MSSDQQNSNELPTTAENGIDPDVEAALAEVRLLIDHVGGSAKCSIAELEMPRPDNWQPTSYESGGQQNTSSTVIGNAVGQGLSAKLGAYEILAKFTEIKKRAEGDKGINYQDTAFVLLLRDKLNAVISPATGMTVAYTWMVSGNTSDKPRPKLDLARQAYPGLVNKAWWHRWGTRLFILLAILATAFAVWEATKVALGKSLLASLQELRAQQVMVNAEKVKLQATSDNTKQWKDPTFPGPPELSLRPCENASYRFQELSDIDKKRLETWAKQSQEIERAKTKALGKPDTNTNNPIYSISIFRSLSEQEICDKDLILASNFGIFFQGLRKYNEDWPSLVGRSFQLVQSAGNNIIQMISSVTSILTLFWNSTGDRSGSAEQQNPPGDDIEWVVIARLLVLGNYVLPVVFALLGAIAYVMVDYFNKIRASLLSPRDLGLACIRIVLGLLVGACIGLLYSSAVPVYQAPGVAAGVSGLLNTLTLSASGVAFLAGFAVEGVFSMLEMLARRIFPANAESAPK